MKNKCIVKKAFFKKNNIRESSAFKYALTIAVYICHCWQNGRYFYKTHLATLHGAPNLFLPLGPI